MHEQLKERLLSREDVVGADEAERVIADAFEPYFRLFDEKPHERAGFGMGVGRLAQFLLGSTTIVEI